MIILFYKQILQVGGAENLFLNHYLYLKNKGKDVRLLTFKFNSNLLRKVERNDLILLNGRHWILGVISYIYYIFTLKPERIFCHSGLIETYLSTLFFPVKYFTFFHHPTSMTVNDTDKFSLIFWRRFIYYHSNDYMFPKIYQKYKSLKLIKKIYINFRTIISQKALSCSHRIFVLTKKAQIELKNIYGYDSYEVSGAITTEKLNNISLIKSKRRITADSVINLLTISRLEEDKRIDIILESINILIKKGINLKLIIGGTGSYKEQLLSRSNELNLDAFVQFEGFIPSENLDHFYDKADLFITIDWADYRITTYEAIARKTKVIVSDDTAESELLESSYLFTSPCNAKELADTILRAIYTSNKWDDEKLIKYLSSFTWDSYFSNVEKISAI